ncbi:MAG: hypothetical protein IJL69_03620 [Oscillospiraceae bacterium]|jgi:energy-coupling factor transporter transmembrane protein EcfT|nr:hypothetical protein [Oscillospiraceae bacterium]
MSYTETARSRLKPVWAFLIALGVFTAIFVTVRLLPIENYRVVAEIVMLLLIVGVVYFLYRYALTPFTYSVSDGVFTVSKGEKLHKSVVAVIRKKDVRLFAPSSYTGKTPKGEFRDLNCCPGWNGKARGWSLWCRFEDGTCARLYLDPSDELVAVLTEFSGGKTAESEAL